jgi:hypothetical protein
MSSLRWYYWTELKRTAVVITASVSHHASRSCQQWETLTLSLFTFRCSLSLQIIELIRSSLCTMLSGYNMKIRIDSHTKSTSELQPNAFLTGIQRTLSIQILAPTAAKLKHIIISQQPYLGWLKEQWTLHNDPLQTTSSNLHEAKAIFINESSWTSTGQNIHVAILA